MHRQGPDTVSHCHPPLPCRFRSEHGTTHAGAEMDVFSGQELQMRFLAPEGMLAR